MRGCGLIVLLAMGVVALVPPVHCHAANRGRGQVCDARTGNCHQAAAQAPRAACATAQAKPVRKSAKAARGAVGTVWKWVAENRPKIRRGNRGC